MCILFYFQPDTDESEMNKREAATGAFGVIEVLFYFLLIYGHHVMEPENSEAATNATRTLCIKSTKLSSKSISSSDHWSENWFP